MEAIRIAVRAAIRISGGAIREDLGAPRRAGALPRRFVRGLQIHGGTEEDNGRLRAIVQAGMDPGEQPKSPYPPPVVLSRELYNLEWKLLWLVWTSLG